MIIINELYIFNTFFEHILL